MTEASRKFWISEWYHTVPNEIDIDFEKAKEFLILAKNELLDADINNALYLGNIARDFIRIGQENETFELKANTNPVDNKIIDYLTFKGKVSILSTNELLSVLPNVNDDFKLIILKRLFDEGVINNSINKIDYSEFSDINKEEYFSLLCSYTNDYKILVKTHIELKDFLRLSPIVHKIANDVCNSSISLKFALKTLKDINLYNDNSLRIIAGNLASCGKISEMASIFSLIKNQNILKEELKYLLNRKYFFSYNRINKELFLNELKKIKGQFSKLYYKLLKEILSPDINVNEELIEFTLKHKRKQIDDIIHFYLLKINKFKESVIFTDKTQGVNRFEQYKQSFIKLIDNKEIDFVIEKLKLVKDNDVKIDIVNKLTQIDKLNYAIKVKKEVIKSSSIRKLTDDSFIQYYARKGDIDEIKSIIKKDKIVLSRIMKYHNVARYFMGLKYKHHE